jgi:hypothetical protein
MIIVVSLSERQKQIGRPLLGRPIGDSMLLRCCYGRVRPSAVLEK